MVPDRNVRARQIAGPGNAGVRRDHNRCFADTVSLPPHHALFKLRRLVHGPMASAADIPGAFALASMSFGIALERSEAIIRQRNCRIDAGEPGRVLAASFDVELIVETFLDEVALFV